jgi:glucose-1-phosphate adenylyltransferase
MINRKAIGYITANYSSTYGSVLLKDRPIASVPFLGRYRLIDFPLSNMMNAGIKTVGVVMPGNYRSLIDHVGSGKDWGLDRKKGGLFMVPGNAYGTTKGGMRFLLRDIISNKTLFQRSDKPYVVMMGTNIIFNMDLNTIIDAHENSGAQMTVVYCKATRPPDGRERRRRVWRQRLHGLLYRQPRDAARDHRPLPGRRLSGSARGTPGRLWQHRRVQLRVQGRGRGRV